jgi:hypothetical protein
MNHSVDCGFLPALLCRNAVVIQIGNQVHAGWHWVVINGLFIVIAINFAILACAIALAIHAFGLSRRIKRLAVVSERSSVLVDKLMKEVDDHAQALEALQSHPPVTPAARSEIRCDAAPPAASQIREEIETLREEISSLSLEVPPAEREAEPVPQQREPHPLALLARHEIESVRAELAEDDNDEVAAADAG